MAAFTTCATETSMICAHDVTVSLFDLPCFFSLDPVMERMPSALLGHRQAKWILYRLEP